MSSYEVTIDLTPPRSFAVKGGSIVFSAAGLPDIKLPAKCTTYAAADTPDGTVATSVTLPRRIAENEDLIAPFDEETNEPTDTMSRHDWYRAFAMAAILIRGESEDQDVRWEANYHADRMTER